MSTLLRMFQSSTGKSGGVQEDALLAVSTLTEGMVDYFVYNMEHFANYINRVFIKMQLEAIKKLSQIHSCLSQNLDSTQ
jgi:hypothetical protein